MKMVCNISHIKKILIMLLLVVFLAACGETDVTIGEACTDEQSAQGYSCVDINDVGCLGCRIFTLLFNAASSSVMKLHGQLTSGAMSLMMVCFAVWLAVRLLKFVSSATESSIAQVWNDILKQAFLCVFCGILASSPDMLIYAVNTFVYPIYVAMLKLGVAIMETSIKNSDGTATSFEVYGKTVTIAKVNLVCTFDKVGLITKDGFPQEFLDAIVCIIKVLKHYLTIGGDVARTLMSQNTSFLGWIAGAVLWIFFLIVRVGMVFYLVDTIFQMGIIILLLPVFILAYAFKSTSKWTGSCFKNLLSSAGFLMCFSIVVTMVLRAMVELIANNPSLFSPGRPELDAANFGLGALCLLLIGALIYGSMGVTDNISNALIGNTADKNFQKNMIQVLNKVKGWTVSALVGAISFGSSILPAKLQEKINKIQAARDKINRFAGRKK